MEGESRKRSQFVSGLGQAYIQGLGEGARALRELQRTARLRSRELLGGGFHVEAIQVLIATGQPFEAQLAIREALDAHPNPVDSVHLCLQELFEETLGLLEEGTYQL